MEGKREEPEKKGRHVKGIERAPEEHAKKVSAERDSAAHERNLARDAVRRYEGRLGEYRGALAEAGAEERELLLVRIEEELSFLSHDRDAIVAPDAGNPEEFTETYHRLYDGFLELRDLASASATLEATATASSESSSDIEAEPAFVGTGTPRASPENTFSIGSLEETQKVSTAEEKKEKNPKAEEGASRVRHTEKRTATEEDRAYGGQDREAARPAAAPPRKEAPPTPESKPKSSIEKIGAALDVRIAELQEVREELRSLDESLARERALRTELKELERGNERALGHLQEEAAALREPAVEKEVAAMRAAFERQDAAIEADARERGIFERVEKLASWYSSISFRYKLATAVGFLGLSFGGGFFAAIGATGLAAQRAFGGLSAGVLTEASLQEAYRRKKGSYATGLRRDWYTGLGIGMGSIVGGGLLAEAVGKAFGAALDYFSTSVPAENLADAVAGERPEIPRGGIGAAAAGEYAAVGETPPQNMGGSLPPLVEESAELGEAPIESAETVPREGISKDFAPLKGPEAVPIKVGPDDTVWSLTRGAMEKNYAEAWSSMSRGERIYFLDYLTKELAKLPANELKDIVPSGDVNIVAPGQLFHFDILAEKHRELLEGAIGKAGGLDPDVARTIADESGRRALESAAEQGEFGASLEPLSARAAIVEYEGFTVEHESVGGEEMSGVSDHETDKIARARRMLEQIRELRNDPVALAALRQKWHEKFPELFAITVIKK